jgi:hypothetical protein
MITVFGEGRGFRVVWLLEEMGLAYRLRPVDPLPWKHVRPRGHGLPRHTICDGSWHGARDRCQPTQSPASGR